MIYDSVQKSWTKFVMTLSEGDSKRSNQSAQRETSYKCSNGGGYKRSTLMWNERSFEFGGRNSLRGVDCNIPNFK
jgi:hypothetical protein